MADDPVILFAKPKTISPADKAALKAIGVTVITVADPSSVKLTRAHSEISGGAMLTAAATCILGIKDGDYGSNVKKHFANLICDQLVASQLRK